MGGIVNAVGNAVGDAVNAVESAVDTVAGAVENVAQGAAGAVGNAAGIVASTFGDVLDTVGQLGGGIFDALGGVIGDVAGFLNPVDFFQNIAGGVGGLVGDLMSGPLGDIAGAITDPLFNFGNEIAGFADSIFSGNLLDTIKNTITDYPISQLPGESLKDAVNDTLEQLTGLGNVIDQMLDRINELSRRTL